MSTFAEIAILILLLITAVSMACAFGVLRNWYKKAQQKKCDAVFNYDNTIQTTTKLPIPVFAAECHHNWSVVDKAVLDMPHEQKYVMTMKCDMCGVIDKTVEVTSKQPPPSPPPPAPPCKHEWETVERTKLGTETEYKVVVLLKCVKCGELDKTVESIKIPAPPAPEPPRSECRHKWVTEKTASLDSAYEQMVKGLKAKGGGNTYYGSGSNRTKDKEEKKLELDLDNAPKWMFAKTYVNIRTCSLCGEVDKTITSNLPEGCDCEPEAEE